MQTNSRKKSRRIKHNRWASRIKFHNLVIFDICCVHPYLMCNDLRLLKKTLEYIPTVFVWWPVAFARFLIFSTWDFYMTVCPIMSQQYYISQSIRHYMTITSIISMPLLTLPNVLVHHHLQLPSSTCQIQRYCHTYHHIRKLHEIMIYRSH